MAARRPSFGREYLIPRPFDPRLLVELSPAVAQAAMDSGMATRPIADMDAYREKLAQFVYRTSLMMKPVYDRARADQQARGVCRRRRRSGAARGADRGRRRPGLARS